MINYLILVINVFHRSLERASMASRGGPVTVFLWKTIATCDFPEGVGADLDPPMSLNEIKTLTLSR